jgi:hypothetical protein
VASTGQYGVADSGDSGLGTCDHQRFDNPKRNPPIASNPHFIITRSRFRPSTLEQPGDLFERDNLSADMERLV